MHDTLLDIDSRSWREAERTALIDFATQAPVTMGFGYMDDEGCHQDGHGVELWINGRFTHVFFLEHMLGNPRATDLADFGLDTLRWRLRDRDYGGWFTSIDPWEGEADGIHARGIPFDEAGATKAAYAHGFVVLAAASAVMAGHGDGDRLLDDAMDIFDRYWWEPHSGRVCESYDRQWSVCEPYRGVNANMHTVECLLAAYDATGDSQMLSRAQGIVEFVLEAAAERQWRIAEHYDEKWNIDLDYHKDQAADPFRPWGATVGHGFEWARLAMQTACAVEDAKADTDDEFIWEGGDLENDSQKSLTGTNNPHSDSNAAQKIVANPMFRDAMNLLQTALYDGWNVDGQPGFVYTTDFDGRPIVHERMHWVVCEALNAVNVARRIKDAATNEQAQPADIPDDVDRVSQDVRSSISAKTQLSLVLEPGESGVDWVKADMDKEVTLEDYERQWWKYAADYFIEKPGQWREELDRDNQLSTKTWVGKPEIYHAYQALILPEIDPRVSFAKAVKNLASINGR